MRMHVVYVYPFLCKSVTPATAVGVLDMSYSAPFNKMQIQATNVPFWGKSRWYETELVKVRIPAITVPRIISFLTWNAGNKSKGQ